MRRYQLEVSNSVTYGAVLNAKGVNVRTSLAILADWGTTSCTLMLCEFRDGQPVCIEERMALGAKFCEDFETQYFEETQDWYDKHGDLPAFLCGMVGSSQGWMDAGYVEAPTDLEHLSPGARSINARGCEIKILPGVKCRNRLGLLDVMRGEEVQIFGWASLPGAPVTGRSLLCLPGTHTKWVLFEAGRIQEFTTMPRGEVHEILTQHSILLDRKDVSALTTDQALYSETVREVNREPEIGVLSRLFSVRSHLVLGEFTAAQASTYLSALLIGTDIKDGMHLYGGDPAEARAPVQLIGSSANTARYGAAFDALGLPFQVFDGAKLSMQGICRAVQSEESAAL